MKKDYELVKVSTCAKMKNISVQTVYDWIKNGKIESVKIDNVCFVKLNNF